MDHGPGSQAPHGAEHRGTIGQIERVNVYANRFPSQQAAKFRPQLTGCTGYKDAHERRNPRVFQKWWVDSGR